MIRIAIFSRQKTFKEIILYFSCSNHRKFCGVWAVISGSSRTGRTPRTLTMYMMIHVWV